MPLIANRVTEADIRAELTDRGYDGAGAKFEELELHAIERPGWLQVFRFRILVAHPGQRRELLFGAALDDERSGRFELTVDRRSERRDGILHQWTEGLILCPNRKGNLLIESLVFATLLSALLLWMFTWDVP